MLSLDEAQERLLAAVAAAGPWPTETLPLAQARGRVLAQDVIAAVDVPPLDNAAMDGFALRAADVPTPGTRLPWQQRIAAGRVGGPLAPGTAARIFTGAPVPEGADAVVMQEQCDWTDQTVDIQVVPQPGTAVRRRGEDVQRGSVVLPRGTRLSPQALGLAASVGVPALDVARPPRVLLLTTGDELTVPGLPLRPGAIYNANADMLKALVESMGAVCVDGGTVPDRLDATRDALRQAAQDHDLVLCSGGVSVGEEDHLKAAVVTEGRLDQWQIAIKPGKPLAVGELRRQNGGAAWFIGLPGNPVSSFVTCLMMVAPFLLRLQGAVACQPQALQLRAGFDWPRADKRREFLRVRREGPEGLALFPHQGSGVLTSVVWADGLVDNPPGQVIRAGDWVRYLPFNAWSSP
ncbi:MAG: gephyrin-like molybdotransferase Glp [Pseudomonadota bacterium]